MRTAPPSVGEKYALGHGALPSVSAPRDLLDGALLAFALQGAWATGVADSYAALFRRNATLRLKLILFLAILENTAGIHSAFDEGTSGGRVGTFLGLTAAGIRWVSRLLAGIVVFTPVRVVASVIRNRHG